MLDIHERGLENESQSIVNSNEEPEEDEEEDLNESSINYDQLTATLFFLASILYVYLAYLDGYNSESYLFAPISIFASHLFVLISFLTLVGWKVNREENEDTPQQRYLLAPDPYQLDWSGWGDWSLLVGSLIDAGISYTDDWPPRTQYFLSLFSDLFWMLNAVLYTVGYVYGQDVRRRFASKYYTSLNILVSEQPPPDDVTLYKNELIVI